MKKLLLLIALIGLFWGNAYAKSYDGYTYCSKHYCALIPNGVIVINQENFLNYLEILPESIEDRFMAGTARELWVFTEEDNLAVAVEYKPGTVRIDSPDRYCEEISSKLNEPQVSCGHMFPYRVLRGLQSTTYKNPETMSFIRVFMPLNGGSVYFVCAGKWESQKELFRVYHKMRDIIKYMVIRKSP